MQHLNTVLMQLWSAGRAFHLGCGQMVISCLLCKIILKICSVWPKLFLQMLFSQASIIKHVNVTETKVMTKIKPFIFAGQSPPTSADLQCSLREAAGIRVSVGILALPLTTPKEPLHHRPPLPLPVYQKENPSITELTRGLVHRNWGRHTQTFKGSCTDKHVGVMLCSRTRLEPHTGGFCHSVTVWVLGTVFPSALSLDTCWFAYCDTENTAAVKQYLFTCIYNNHTILYNHLQK